ncbi:Inositol-pentakisphosphate 2-kinase [Handroanthus impetiginosus]|uniref:Inositol-tetrakisphosphate 1-kinase n=1 Tax=Handroanthus impetiginosus TaxID=429701 RepID=A0A2G9I188_9LAMI|nr:Inositol-pentakisphosphate 2-kinase [Handroanthus impetiginosus]
MSEKPNRYRIMYALAPKKVQSFIQPSLLNLAKERGIDLVPIEFAKPLIDQFPFDCLIHKVSHPEWINQLQQFIAQYPNVVVIDHPDAIQRLHSRITMLQVVKQLNLTPEVTIDVPKQVFVESPESLPDSLASKGVNFPVIAKPLVADGSAGSHQMSLVFNEDGLGELKLNSPFVLQEFVNHGGVIFKVYVAGQHIQRVKRRSLPDISEEKLAVSENLLSFSQISNVTAQDQSDESVAKLMEAAELPPLSFVNEVACQLKQALKLNLFNFDMIRDSKNGGRYLVIDINYFPGYAKMPCYETILTDFFLDVVQQKQSLVSDDCEPV